MRRKLVHETELTIQAESPDIAAKLAEDRIIMSLAKSRSSPHWLNLEWIEIDNDIEAEDVEEVKEK